MSTTKDDTFDYEAYVKQHAPNSANIQRGTDTRKQRFEAVVMKRMIRIDDDILEQFQQFVSPAQTCERLINQALREWLSAKNVKELVRTEIQQVVQQVLSTPKVGKVKKASRSKSSKDLA
jgi:uncharacterized protein (DUF4415 family)